MSFKIYQVGGSVRDELMGLKTKDHDFVFCLDDVNKSVDEGWEEMKACLKLHAFEVFLETKDAFTIRAKFHKNHKYAGMVADFVMARSESGYERGVSRKPNVKLGTLYDDLLRRDFTVNAIAKDDDGTLYDFFNGQEHIKNKILITPIAPEETFLDDPLRILRAIRFMITKDFTISASLTEAMRNPKVVEYFKVVSDDRIKEELMRCFKFNTGNTIVALCDGLREINRDLYDHIFNRDIWLKPTNEQR